MNRADITIRNPKGAVIYHHLHTAPAKWAELSVSDLLIFAAVMCSGLELSLARNVLAAMLYDIPKKVFRYVDPGMTLKLAESVAFLFSKNELHRWLIPSFRFRLVKYHGPRDRLVNITADEFGKCEQCYEQFNNTRNRDYIDTLVAVLYRRRRFTGIADDIRADLTDLGYIRRAKRFKRLPNRLKTAIFLNYEGCRHLLHKKYPEVFTPSKTGAKGSAVTVTPWSTIIQSGSNDIFGPHEATKSTRLHDFLSRLNSRIKEAKDLEERQRS